MSRTLPVILLFLATLLGCSSMSGLGGSSSFACKAPDGVACESVSGTWANAVAGNLPRQQNKSTSQPSPQKDPAPPAAFYGATPGTQSTALRSNAHTLRLWIKPWVDIDGDLYDNAFIYVQVNSGKWLLDHIERPTREAFAPLRAPTASPAAEGSSARIPPSAPPNGSPGGTK
ncbi:MAG: TraV family lipoprotein [Betaproteobacteria bacterium]|nr:TraV family lipoprotein [Betaproteobacteria bacterium]